MRSSTFLDAAGARLEARFVGSSPAGAPMLVFLHEGLGSVGGWKDFPDRVCDATGLGALVYSRRGYGASDPVEARARPVRYMHDEAYVALPAVLEAANLADVILVGHSDGASIALLFAAEEAKKEKAQRVRGVVAMAPHLFVEDVSVKSIAAIAQAWETTDLRGRLARYHGANVDGAFLGWSGAWLDPEFRAWNIEREVARIVRPVLVIQGGEDEYGTLAQVESLKRLARGGVETHVLAECGHAPWRDQADQTLQAITSFVTKLIA
ncbi:MAG: alpha/beta fold hydrolase [Polyangiaceae bacterium]